jgi:uncharacterized membrane protein (DUF4010 family)
MSALAGTIALCRLAVRRDRFKLAAYLAGLTVLMAGMLAGIGGQSHEAWAPRR